MGDPTIVPNAEADNKTIVPNAEADNKQGKNMSLSSQVKVSLAVFAALLLSVSGCGGGGGSGSGGIKPTPTPPLPTPPPTTKGRAQVLVKWPTRGAGRGIPTYADSVKAQLLSGTDVLQSVTTVRPPGNAAVTQTLDFPDALPAGAYRLRVSAYTGTESAGTPVAAAYEPLTVPTGGVASATVTLDSTIRSFSVVPLRNPVRVGESVTLNYSAKDAEGAAILLPPSALQWSVALGEGATLRENAENGAAVLTIVSGGTVRVQAFARESGVGNASEVTALPITELRLNRPDTAAAPTRAGYPVTLSADYVDADGKKYAYPMGTLTWTMVSGGDIASVTPQGVINSTGDGVARVRVTDSQFGLSAESDFTFEAYGNGVQANVQ
jgi:hypothetical protein